MIHLSRGPAPPLFQAGWFHDERIRSYESHARGPAERAQRSPSDRIAISIRREAGAALLAQSHGKCAYCESSVGASGAWVVESYRPKGGALEFDGSVSRDHYFWLA